MTSLAQLTAPAYKIEVDGLLASKILRDRLVSLNVTLNNGVTSDQLSMTFDDRSNLLGGYIAVPSEGKKIKVWMGYELPFIGLVEMGAFVVNHTSLSGASGGQTLTVSATPSLMLTESTATWGGQRIDAIVNAIADRHGLKASVSAAYKGVIIETLNQHYENDLTLLTRLAQRHDAIVKPMAGKLLFLEKAEAKNALGMPLLIATFSSEDITNWSVNLNGRQRFSAVIARYPDCCQATYVEVTEGKASAPLIYRLPDPYNNEEEAKAAAAAKLEEFKRADTLNVTVIGRPEITAEGKIALTNIRDGVNGEWVVKSATHTFSSGGYQTSLQAYRENTL
ncbi:MAG: contractile injection system protein, VgrG/Pvc8 family [Pseudomonadales bacterium]